MEKVRGESACVEKVRGGEERGEGSGGGGGGLALSHLVGGGEEHRAEARAFATHVVGELGEVIGVGLRFVGESIEHILEHDAP